jgi:hypothetical protein
MVTFHTDLPDILLFEVFGIRADILPSKTVSGRIPDLKKGRIIRPDIRCIPSAFRTDKN